MVDVDAVLFDLDGTLIDSGAAVRRSWLTWAQQEGIDPRLLVSRHGWPSAAIVEALLPPERRKSALRRIDDLEVADTEGVIALPGAVELLAALAADAWAIATSCGTPLAHARIAAAALPMPEVLVTAHDVSRGKPDPEPYLLAAELLGVDPARCLVVEDAPAGLAAARSAGARTLAVTTTYGPSDLDADIVVPSLASVAAADVTFGGVRLEVLV